MAVAETPSGAASAASAKPTPLLAFVSFYHDQRLVMQTPSLAVTPLPGSRLGMVPLSFDVNIGQLPPGGYDCQVSVLDPSGGKVSLWPGPLVLVR